MKIWEAKLSLIYTIEDKWKYDFTFQSDNRDYKMNERGDYWTHFKDWVGYKIPVIMEVLRTFSGNLEVVKGFTRELSAVELKDLEKEMKMLLVGKLIHEKESYLMVFKEKIECLK